MPKFNVRVKGILNARGNVEIEADSKEEALKQVKYNVEWGQGQPVDWRFIVVCSAETEDIKEIE